MSEEFRSQANCRLKINTALDGKERWGGDPLLLIAVAGEEWMSKPFEYTVTLWREIQPDEPGKPKGYVMPQDMINTKVMFGVRIEEWHEVTHTEGDPPEDKTETVLKGYSYAYRCGVFEKFNYEGFIGGRFMQYSATIVPVFKMMQYETCFRVFENKTVADILQDFKKREANLMQIDLTRLAKVKYPRMEYCVQFNESSYNFLSRLMRRFGISFYFEHDPKTMLNTMVLCPTDAGVSYGDCRINDPFPNSDGMPKVTDIDVSRIEYVKSEDDKEWLLGIRGFRANYIPTIRRYRGGDFNPLTPMSHYGGFADILPSRDLVDPERRSVTKRGARTPPSDDDRFHTESFPDPANANDEAGNRAKAEMAHNEAGVIVYGGSTRNPAFFPGQVFHLVDVPDDLRPKDKDGQDPDVFEKHPAVSPSEAGGHYVITYNKIAALEDAHRASLKHWYDIFATFWHNLIGDSNPEDVAANFTGQGLNNFLQNDLPLRIHPVRDDKGNINFPDFTSYFLGGGLAGATAAVPALVKAIASQLKSPSNTFSNSFSAVRLDAPAPPRSLMLPLAEKVPVAYGPHLATVIGDRGSLRVPGNDVYADLIGRVRVRFPWQWMGEPPETAKWESDDNTCWVRVSQGWAGRMAGWQFIPRVGEEVIVEFIAGDPDRPIITGRVFNADRGASNLPFTTNRVVDKDSGQVNEPTIHTLSDLRKPDPRHWPYSGIRTDSIPTRGGNPDKPTRLPMRFHMLRFDDTRDKEQLLLRSQGRLDLTALNSYYETVEGNRHVKVVPAKQGSTYGEEEAAKTSRKVGGSSFTSVAGEYDLHVGDALYEQVEKNYELTVKADTLLDVKGKLTAVVGDTVSINAASIVLDATKKITLKVGGSSIVITNGNIYIWGPPPTQIDTANGGPDPAASATLQDVAGAATADPGDPLNWRELYPSGHGGGRRGHHVAQAQDAIPVSKEQAELDRDQEISRENLERKLQMSIDPSAQLLQSVGPD
jgi:uncharacterized protein involved in type VI secretion and phage assembly